MQILHVLNHIDFANGHVHVAVDLACAQLALGHDVAVASAGGHYEDLLERSGVKHYKIALRRQLSVFEGTFSLRTLVAKLRPTIIHAHMVKSAVIGRIAAKAARSKLVTHVHNSFKPQAIVMGIGDRVIAVSNSAAAQLTASGIKSSKIRVVLNGPLNSPRLPHSFESVSDLMRPAVVTLCGLHERKGVRDLLAAFEIAGGNFSEAHLYIVGNGPQRRNYEAIAARGATAARIHFLGSIADPRPILAAADIFALASRADPCPLVIPEARAARCAIVATNVDGIPELLEGGACGKLVPPQAPQALATAICELLGSPQKLSEARARAHHNLERFTVSALCNRIETVYSELAA